MTPGMFPTGTVTLTLAVTVVPPGRQRRLQLVLEPLHPKLALRDSPYSDPASSTAWYAIRVAADQSGLDASARTAVRAASRASAVLASQGGMARTSINDGMTRNV